ncbi:hypothetical protein PMIT1323_00384 [Prochlorococcus marinus str. MIT 1323]|nr:hypothetical protein PMIT1323_00384 [Prochlorococcus marinus str. MIT 1323]
MYRAKVSALNSSGDEQDQGIWESNTKLILAISEVIGHLFANINLCLA